jgi:hypothetical protein
LKDAFKSTVCELLAQSLLAWGLSGSVRSECEGVILVACKATEIRIEPATEGLPFHWMVTVNGRMRGAISLVAVLRQVRGALDPGYPMNQVRVAAFPPVPS